MLEIIDQYEAGGTDLRRMVDELGVMYQSLTAEERPPERPWVDAFLPLDRSLAELHGRDRRLLDARISRRVEDLKRLIRARQAPPGLSAAGGGTTAS